MKSVRGNNIKDATCSDQRDSEGNLTGVDYSGCECKVPPPDDTDPPGDSNNNDPDDDDPGEPDDESCPSCGDYQSRCSSECNFSCASDSEGCAISIDCDCSGVNPDPEPDDPRDPNDPADNPPSDDPSDPEDGNGWLESIKENTDILVEQGREANGWLEGIKHNSDDQLQVSNDQLAVQKEMEEDLDQIKKNTKTVADNSKKLYGTVGTSVGDSDYSIDSEATGYGSSPTDDDLPTAEDLNTSFGTFTPSTETPGYISTLETSLDALKPSFTSSVCTFDVSFYYSSSLFTIDYQDTFSLCEYEIYFNMIGNLLIGLAAFWNFYALVFKS